MALTPKMERFAQLIALEGLSQSEAYRHAYNVSPDSDPATTWQNASHMATKVKPRIAELRAASQERAVVTAAEILDKLKAIGFAEVEGPLRWSDKVAALDKMAKILGLYRDTEVQQPRAAITQVTVVLHHGAGGTSTESRRIVDGAGRMLEPSADS